MFGLSRQQQQQENELYAFDLTWRNYLPSISHLCVCLPFMSQSQGILLADDHDNNADEIHYYNDIYQAKAVRGYLEDQLDRDFDDLLLTTDERHDPQTENPVEQQQDQTSSSDEQESIFSDRDSGVYTPSRSIPYSDDSSIATSHTTTTTETAVHPILSERLDDLTEKLNFIRNNMVMANSTGSLTMDYVHPLDKPSTFSKSSHDMTTQSRYLRKYSMVSTTSSQDYSPRRLSYGPDLCSHGLQSDYTFSASSYFTGDEDEDDFPSSGIQDAVFSFGKRWFGELGFP